MASLRSRSWVGSDVVMCSDQSKLRGGSCGGGVSCSVRWRHRVSPPLPKLRVIASASIGVSSAAVQSDSYSSSSYSSTMFDRSASVPPARRVMEEEEIVSGKVDQWIRNSVNEIVNNIEEAPFLVHFYSNSDKSSPATKLVREKASADSWPGIKTRWQGGSSSIPNGIALVEELYDDENSLHLKQNQDQDVNLPGPACSSHKVWGIVIQERGVSCPSCYILKTTRVRTGVGICTHYCLFRAECFGESVESQLQKLFLV